ncbi:hypothetical protein LSH36_217g04053 [Paralvinella palmiformis]|uniref:folate gamma-glutamyl hydrolase n=1 Tax=Paralvinella palmiformis TaxID=53620 RepID=A0AAD9JNB2_9ANNE|nr:hypothetical protein LSH36_217g04053 [Paralvinella palmiformis]
MYLSTFCWFFLLVSFHLIACTNSAERRPVIGILAQAASLQDGDSYIFSAYVKFIEQAGALVVPLRIKESKGYYKTLFEKLNGFAYGKGDFFPILGICQGFEEFTIQRTKTFQLGRCDGLDYSSPLVFTNDARRSRMFRGLSDDLFEAMKNWNVTYNNHQYCMRTEVFNKTKQLSDFYRVLSRNVAKDGVEFISTIEAYDYPFYGTQWHPEKNIYLWSDAHVNHSAIAVKVSQYIANFFVNEARKSKHSFEVNDLANSVIFNYQPKFMGAPSFHDVYFFNNDSMVT